MRLTAGCKFGVEQCPGGKKCPGWRPSGVGEWVSHSFGMAWSTPAIRTAAQAGLVILAASGANLVDVAVWKSAGLAVAAALLSELQRRARSV